MHRQTTTKMVRATPAMRPVGILLAIAGAAGAYTAAVPSAHACTTRKLCVTYTLSLTDGETGDYVGVGDPTVPARGAHVIIVRPYPEPVLDGYLSVEAGEDVEAGCIEFDSQFAAGHKAVVEAQAILDAGTNPDRGIVVRGFPLPFMGSDPDLTSPLGAWEIDMPPGPDGYSYAATIVDTDDAAGMATLFAVSTETVYRLHGLPGSLLDGIHELNVFIQKDGQNAFAHAPTNGIAVGEFGGLDKKFIIGHEIGHWVQLQVAGGFGAFNLNYGPAACDPPHDPFSGVRQGTLVIGCPHNPACQFFVVGTLEGMIEDTNTNPNRHGIRSAEFSSSAMIEGFGHYVAAAAYNDLQTTGRYQYYKDVDEANLTDYLDFEQGANARQIELAGGSLSTTVGGRSQWTNLECSEDIESFNDWDHPLDGTPAGQEVSTEIDWLRLFWQYVTASYSGTDPSGPPGFWDGVQLVTESHAYSPNWSGTVVWPRMDAAIDSFLAGNDWVVRWRDLSGEGTNGNAVFNDGAP